MLDPIIELAAKNLRLAYKYRAKVALGANAGAYMVLHGKGLMDEYQAFMDILGESGDVRAWLADGEKRIQDTFRRLNLDRCINVGIFGFCRIKGNADTCAGFHYYWWRYPLPLL